jgi:lysophospholipase L1-like esterase
VSPRDAEPATDRGSGRRGVSPRDAEPATDRGSGRRGRARRLRWWLVALLVGAPIAFLGLLVVQALLASRAERIAEPDYRVEAVVAPTGEAEGAPLRLALLGDSTAAGLGAPTQEGTLGVQIAERVAAELGRPVEVMGYGISGARTADVAPLQVPEVEGFDPDVVVVMVGSNDVTHLTTPSRLRTEIADLAAAIDAELGAPAVLGGIPLFGSADLLGQPLRAVVDRYAAVLRPAQRDAAQQSGMTFVEIARDASPRFEGVPDAMSPDGFHPAPVGYGFWADAVAPAVIEALGG